MEYYWNIITCLTIYKIAKFRKLGLKMSVKEVFKYKRVEKTPGMQFGQNISKKRIF